MKINNLILINNIEFLKKCIMVFLIKVLAWVSTISFLFPSYPCFLKLLAWLFMDLQGSSESDDRVFLRGTPALTAEVFRLQAPHNKKFKAPR
jgi:hypothetical protein